MFEARILYINRDLTQAEYQRFLAVAAPEKRARIGRFRFFADAQRALLGDMLARMLVAKAAGQDGRGILFDVGAHGKPFVLGRPDIHFNISHAGRYIAGAVDSSPVGIDIEVITPVKEKIADRFFAEDEKAYISAVGSAESTRRFFSIWTRKEAYIKRDGRGLGVPLPSFSVLNGESANGARYHMIFSDESAIGHICTHRPDPPACAIWTVDEFLGAFWE
ncbi:MAG: 4'-phosphopantetheinyl transferase superfamily protein [Oscillospiraceae bacterium]|jgi:4'-phosphopantetheinyl transferase|nr:4'-phosphopantetheinyl transferase superfamily protein [Oscillospiraceae bacterium]